MPTRIEKDAQVVTILDGAKSAVAGDWFLVPPRTSRRAVQGSVTGSGLVTATIAIEGSNDGANALLLGTIMLNGATPQSDGLLIDAPWAYVRARVVSVSGTNATVSSQLGF
ncbi:hypothetical protein M0D69_13950 [Caballeronia sp. SEWSISQ10-4 2]|uniref:hypothetical protein n=1 Tax=Caballeronia sp. SEWSISQ10-4 2 TaxID=2937438 RepID=UPI002652DDB1|nr:hypothetical protein [Caballeronia sp. SEWSISQ10-4 2]MDN7179097.1 hypothetical protein [Caballeronia sp. SEWSISQ10-4 2]